MESIRSTLKWNQRSEIFKTAVLLSIVLCGTLGGYGLFTIAMGTSSPIVVVISGSMEPVLYRGDLLIIQARAAEDIQLKDIVVFQDTTYHPSGPIVHRIIEINEVDGEYEFVTKGDNNTAHDSDERTYDEIIGVVVTIIPWLGNISLFLNELGIVGIIIIFTIILVIPEIYHRQKDESDDNGILIED